MLGDGVDRTARIGRWGFARANPQRVAVSRSPSGSWAVWRGMNLAVILPTHAEAIAYADRMARS